jgi:hypothetical protein
VGDEELRADADRPADGFFRRIKSNEDPANGIAEAAGLQATVVPGECKMERIVLFYDPGDVTDPDHSRPSLGKGVFLPPKRKSASEDALVYRRPGRYRSGLMLPTFARTPVTSNSLPRQLEC